MRWIAMLFPYRTHLESEVEYLRAQLAQRQRRVDELQAQLAAIVNPVKEPRRMPPVPLPTKPKGWEAYRAAKRDEPETEPIAGSEVATAGAGIESIQKAN